MTFTKKIMPFVLFVIISSLVYAQSQKSDFDVDQLLVRVQVKESEVIEKSIKIANYGEKDVEIDIAAQGLDAIVSIGKQSVELKSGSSESVVLSINGLSRGVFVGKMLLSSSNEIKEIPVIIEVESENVLADVSLSPSITTNIYTGSVIAVDFNLISFAERQASVLLNYEIMDFDNNKVFEESENVVVSKKASFTKNFVAPEKAASYVLIAKVYYNDSLGTTTYVFDAVKKESAFLWMLSLFSVVILALLITLKISLKNKRVINPIKMQKIAVEKAKLQKKFDSLAEAYNSGFISKVSYGKSKNKIMAIINKLNKK